MTEYDVVVKIEEFRSLMDGYQGPSFATIAAMGENGAIIHYKPDAKKALPLHNKSTFLLDSGGHYLSGTTDVTRTVFLSPMVPSDVHFEYIKECYTSVLQGHIALASLTFPEGTKGVMLDSFARASLVIGFHGAQK